MYYVYVLRSILYPEQIYTGSTIHLKQRITDHNNGKSAHTSKFAPWELECYVAFPDKQRAYDFEKYLKSHSGRAFAAKRLHRDYREVRMTLPNEYIAWCKEQKKVFEQRLEWLESGKMKLHERRGQEMIDTTQSDIKWHKNWLDHINSVLAKISS